jgi:hypothetical protein
MRVESAKDLSMYKAAYRLAMDIFEVTKRVTGPNHFHPSEIPDCTGVCVTNSQSRRLLSDCKSCHAQAGN